LTTNLQQLFAESIPLILRATFWQYQDGE